VLLTSGVNLAVQEFAPRYPQGHPSLLREAFPEYPRSGVYGLEEVWNVRQAVMAGKPLTEKLCTVWDQTSGQTNVLRVPLGITAEQIFRRDLSRYRNVKLIMGGLLSGRGCFSPRVPVGPEGDGLIMMRDEVAWEGSLCTNCGECVNLCPRGLSPQLIHQAVGRSDRAALESFGAAKCIECGLCSFICPARLHLTHQIKVGKSLLQGAPLAGQTALDNP
jgi:electron transport complex protein RnfC